MAKAKAKRTKTTAFAWKQWNSIGQAVNAMKESALTHIRHGITNKQLFDTFVREEDKDMLTRVLKICDVNTLYQAITYKSKLKDVEIEGLKATFDAKFSILINNDAEFKFLFPQYMQKATLIQPLPELDNVLRLIAEVNFEWKRVQMVLSKLNDECATPAAVKTLCPNLPGLLITDDTHNLGRRLSNMRNTDNLPTLPYELREAAILIGQTITKGLLLQKAEVPPEDDFQITLVEATSKAECWDGSNWSL